MGVARWIGGFLGLVTTGSILGALAGYAMGTWFENCMNPQQNGQGGTDAQTTGDGRRNTYLFSLLTLAAYVIKADHKVMHSEMEMLRGWLRSNFGEEAVEQGESIVKKLMKRQDEVGDEGYKKMIYDACSEIASCVDYAGRLQLLHFLRQLSVADGSFSEEEGDAIIWIGVALKLADKDIESIYYLTNVTVKNDLDAAYKVLGVTAESSDKEVKAAYRELVKKNHPDKVAGLGDDIRKAAEQKMQEINRAKEIVYKARGL